MKTESLPRRSFLKTLAAAAPAISRGAAGSRPNILFCISDDQSYPHASAYGARFVRTPAFDRVAGEGVLFHNSFVSTPSCCPSRGSVLTGQDFYRLREASMNHTIWPGGIPVYTDLLAEAGYHVGFTGKGWGPGNWKISGRKLPLTGAEYNKATLAPPGKRISPIDYAGNFEAFLEARPKNAPFCFWAGFIEPHREFDEGIGEKHGIRLDSVSVPAFLPDSQEVRRDIADYAFEIQWFDRHLERMLRALEKRGALENTIIVVTSDNGMAFPRAKANLYDYGCRMPLALRWGARVKPGRAAQDLVSHADFAPTFLEAAGLQVPDSVTGRSLIPLLDGAARGRSEVVFGIERHFPGSRPQGAGYPSRAIRTAEYLYIRNLTPEANPCGDHPGPVWPEDDPVGGYGDTDGGLSKTYLWRNRKKHPELFQLAFGKRPAEELYAIAQDPFQMRNLAGKPDYERTREDLAARLDAHLKRTADPRALGRGAELDAVMRRFPSLAPGAR
jgi:N-sulfoglucosamine sulfohydrolase